MNFLNKNNLIKRGQKGSDVNELQTFLNKQGSSLKVDGVFGPKTDAALKGFQSGKSIKADGIVGPITRSKMRDNTSTPQETVGSQFSEFNTPTTSSSLDNQLANINKQLEGGINNPSRDALQKTTRLRLQDELDSLARIEEQQRRMARIQTQQELGSERALSSRSGTIGSSFGQQQIGNERTEGRNRDTAIINDVFAKEQELRRYYQEQSDQQYQQDFNNARLNRNDLLQTGQLGEERRIETLGNIANSFTNQGVNPADIDPTELARIAAETGSSSQDIIDAYQTAQTAQEESFTLNQGQKEFRYNPATGEVEEIAFNPKATAAKSSSSSSSSTGSSISNAVTGNASKDELYNAALLTKPITLTKAQSAEFDRQLAAAGDNPEQLRLFIRKRVVDNLPTAERKTKFLDRSSIIEQLNAIESKLQEFEALGGDTGLLVGKKQNITQSLGNIGDPKLAAIGQDVLFAVDLISRSQSGAALTEAEEQFYKNLIPSTKNSGELNIVKINTLRDSLQRTIDTDIEAAIGQTGIGAYRGDSEEVVEEEPDAVDRLISSKLQSLSDDDLFDYTF